MTDKLPRLGLRSIPGVGLLPAPRLLQRFGGPAAVVRALRKYIRGVPVDRGSCPGAAQDRWPAQVGLLSGASAETFPVPSWATGRHSN